MDVSILDLIINEKQKKEEQDRDVRPYLELPLPEDDRYFQDDIKKQQPPEPKRVIVIDL